jgi:hypothetical protein
MRWHFPCSSTAQIDFQRSSKQKGMMMKKFILLGMMVSALTVSVAFAQDTVPSDLMPAETLDQIMADEAAAAADMPADAINDHGDHNPGHGGGHGPGWGGGNGGGWGGGNGVGHCRRGVVCYAKNNRGRTFEERGYDSYDTQRRVMRECNRDHSSRQCYFLGCRRSGR